MNEASSPRVSRPREQIPVLLLEGIHERAEEAFKRRGYTNVKRLAGALSGEALRGQLATTRLLGIRSRTEVTEELLDAAPKLIGIGCFCIGTNQVDLAAAARRGVPVFNAPHSNTRSVAELVVGLAVMLFRGIFPKSQMAHRGEWGKTARGSHELRGKTIAIIGYGHIGSQVSILAESLGMRVIFHDIVPKLTLGNARAFGTLSAVLEEADLVTLHVPQTPQTANLMSAAALDRMKPGAYLINASRGTVVDIDALAERLEDGRIGGCAVDVYPREPKSATERFESPLQGIANAILTPHIGGATLEAQENIGIDVAEKLASYSDQGTTVGAVNFPELGLAPHPGCHRVLHVHRDGPGMLTQINGVFAELGVNIRGEHLQTLPGLGYVVLDIEEVDGDRILPPLRAIEGTIRARILY
jgi:D-3-phosphoglycerate dehydrogenase / 2-oxoglutarate reductase